MSRSRFSSFSSASNDQTLSSRSTTSEESETPSDSEQEAPSNEETKSAASSRISDPERGQRYRQSSEFGNSERKTPPTGRGFAVERGLECSGWDQPGTSCHKHQRFCKCRGIGCTKHETKDVNKQSNPYKIQGCSYYGTEERNEGKGEEREERNEGGREERRMEKREERRVAEAVEKTKAKDFMDGARNLYELIQRVVKP